MVDAALLYLRLIRCSIRSQLTYRASFVALAIGNFLATGASFIATWFLLQRFHAIGGWSINEVAVLYGVVDIAFGLPDLTNNGLEQCGTLVRRGDFDRILLRPRGAVLQLVGREFALRRGGRLAQGLLVLIWGLRHVTTPFGWAAAGLLVFAIGGAVCVFQGLALLQATISFWTLQTLEMLAILNFGGIETSEFPVHIYGRWLQRLFMAFVPVATTTYFPVLIVLHKPDPFGLPLIAHVLAPLVGPLFLLVMIFFWRLGVRRYASTGS